MALENSVNFPSKILLFGEYLVLKGGNALSFPYTKFSLHKSSRRLVQNANFFTKVHQYIVSNELLKSKLSPSFIEDVRAGLHFDSTIPVGYGLGSSGALVAAIYHHYFLYQEVDLKLLKLELAEIESFFHDKSSGIDPLTSYIQKPILSTRDSIKVLESVELSHFSLYDSGVKRNAKEAIKHFNRLTNNTEFQKNLTPLAELSNTMIQHWINGNPIQDELALYSRLQLQLFNDFIPKNVQQKWQQGLADNSYYMKLCGAGMGGMYLKWNVK